MSTNEWAGRDDASRFLAALFQAGDVIEIRAIDVPRVRGGIVAGYFSGSAKAIEAVEALERREPAGVYVTINPVVQALLARYANRLESSPEGTTKDHEVVARRWMLVDVDPTRPKGISSTDAEHEAALERAGEVATALQAQGWPSPIRVDSGNGAHLYYRVDLPVADDRLVERALAALAFRHDDPRANVDRKVFNPARISKVAGTLSRKGDSTDDRPHRRSRVLEIPERVGTVPRELLERLAGSVPQEKKGRARSAGAGARGDAPHEEIDVDALLRSSGLEIAREGPWGSGGYRWILAACPWNHEHTDRSAFVLKFAAGAVSAGCLHSSCKGNGWRELRAIIDPNHATGGKKKRAKKAKARATREVASPEPEPIEIVEPDGQPAPSATATAAATATPTQDPEGRYEAAPGGLFRLEYKDDEDEPARHKLANFWAVIAEQAIEDDGAETRRAYTMRSRFQGREFTFSIPAADLNELAWIGERIGAGAVLVPGLQHRDHVRAAIGMLSGQPRTIHVYTHTGWREVNGVHTYMHAGGAIAASGPVADVTVRLGDALARLRLPDPPEGEELRDAVRASLRFLSLARHDLTFPVLAAVFRAPFGPANFGVHLAGPSGVFKSELAALAQQHFGAGLDARHLPGSWSSTGNALEGLAFSVKDALLVVDDFAPSGSLADAAKLHATADRLFRNAANGAARGRMNADSSLKVARPARGMVLSTGEDVPRGHSIRARLLILDVAKGDMDPVELSKRQADAASGLYAQALAGYVRWLAGDLDGRRRALRKFVEDARGSSGTGASSGLHRRSPEIVAHLRFALGLFLDFALETGTITTTEREIYANAGARALDRAAAAQGAHQHEAEPAERFLSLLASAIASGRAHLASPESGSPPAECAARWGWRGLEPRGDRIGWIDGDDVYLDAESAYRVAQRAGQEGGEGIAVSLGTLKRRLHEKGVLHVEEVAGATRLEVRKSIAGARRRALQMLAKHLEDAECKVSQVSQVSQAVSQADSALDKDLLSIGSNGSLIRDVETRVYARARAHGCAPHAHAPTRISTPLSLQGVSQVSQLTENQDSEPISAGSHPGSLTAPGSLNIDHGCGATEIAL